MTDGQEAYSQIFEEPHGHHAADPPMSHLPPPHPFNVNLSGSHCLDCGQRESCPVHEPTIEQLLGIEAGPVPGGLAPPRAASLYGVLNLLQDKNFRRRLIIAGCVTYTMQQLTDWLSGGIK